MIALLLLARLAAAQAPEGAPAEATAATPAAEGTPAAEAPAAEAAPAAPAEAVPLAIDPAEIVGPPAGPPLTGEALRAKTHDVAKLMRCPVCQGLSVADSPSESALAMKKEVEDLVARGYDRDQILMYFEASYGEFIRLEPKFEGVNVLVWAAPVLLLVAGVGFVGWSMRGKPRAATPAAPTGAPAAAASDAPSPETPAPPDDPALAAYLRKVREETR